MKYGITLFVEILGTELKSEREPNEDRIIPFVGAGGSLLIPDREPGGQTKVEPLLGQGRIH